MSVIVYYFWSPTCGPCKTVKPAVADMAEEDDFKEHNVQWISVNTKDDPNGYTQKFRVTVVPTMVVTKGDQEVGRHSGANISVFYTLVRKGINYGKTN